MSHAEDPFEGFSEFWVEDGVDEGVDAAVDVAQPRGDHEGGVTRTPRQLILDADGVQHVASEERHPTEQKAA